MRRVTALWLVIVASMIAALALHLTGVFPGDTIDYIGGLAGLAITFSTLSVLILRDNPKHRIAIFFLALACNEAVVVWMRLIATSMDPHSKVAGTIGIVEEGLRTAGVAGAGALILFFPTGRLVSKGWRIVVGALVVLPLTATVGQLATPGKLDGLPPVLNPWATNATAAISRVLAPASGLGGVAILAACASLVVRYRRSNESGRRQIKAFSISVIFVVVLIVGLNLTLPDQMNNGLLGSLVWQLPFIVPPAVIAFAIMRHGLFDIDRVISRTVSYAIITVVLAGVFAGIVLVPSGVVGATGAPSSLVAVATLAVVVLFQPLRGRVQRAVDRRFNRARYDAMLTLETFAARLREEVDIEMLRTELGRVVETTMQPAHVGLWLAPSREF